VSHAGPQNQAVAARPDLQLLIDAVVDYAIYMIDLNGRILSWNSGAARLKGYSAEEIIGQPFWRFYTPEDRSAGIPEQALATAKSEGRFLAEGWRVRKDGTQFWALVVIDAIKDGEDRVIGFAKVTRDITERQEAQHRLLESERRYRRLVEAVVDYAIFQLDVNGIVTTWNIGGERIKGYSAEEIIGKHFSVFYTEEDRKAGTPQRALEKARTEGRFETEDWRVRKDGSRFWALVVIDAIKDDDGSVIAFAKVTRDISERQEAIRSRLQSESRYRRLIEAVVDYAIFQLDVNGIVATWNVGAEHIKGYTAEEIIGKHFSAFYTEEDRQAGVPDRALKTAATEGRFEAEGWRVRKDGRIFRAWVVIDAIYDYDKKILGFAKVTRDISERHDAQIALKKTQDQLAASQKMEAVGQLSGGIAHDFNNLLMIVLGNLETVQRQARQITGAAHLERGLGNAMRGAQRAAALTSRLLAFSRRQALAPKPLDVNRFITGAAEFLQRAIGETVDIEAAGGAGLWRIEVDANHLESALVNLAINARDAMPAGGKLTIEAANVFVDEEYTRTIPEMAPGQYVVLSVTDTGSGMSPEVLSRAFEPFYTTKEAGHGTGLGLSQVYGFVKQSGGNVRIYSEIGQGTTIKMYFPRLSGVGTEESEESAEPIIEGEQSETILIVEDDKDLRTYLADILRNLNYRVIPTPNAQSALTILLQADERVDLVLTDVVMPGINGRELGRRAQSLRPGLPVLYMTGYSRNAIVHQGRLDEGVEFLQKPVSQAQLAARIRKLLDTSPVAQGN
jgi:PAS domain S-box-containing protein